MLAWSLAQLAGAVALLSLPTLPPSLPVLILLPLALLALPFPRARWLAALWLGSALAWWQADARLAVQLAPELDGVEIEIAGRILGLVEQDGRRSRFRFAVESGHRAGAPVALPPEIRLSLYDPLPIASGERWQWRVKLRRPRGFANPGGFDYERWLFAENLGATGYVRDAASARRLSAASGMWRADIATRVAALTDGPASGLVRGLATADRSAITDTQWTLLRATGTAHLMAISGLHLGLVAGLALALSALLRKRFAPRLPLAWLAVPAGGLALIYAALAGLGLPLQRALAGLAVLLVGLAARRIVAPGHAFGLALTAVLCLQPLAPLQTGFWLSFGAVAAILFVLAGRRPAGSAWRRGLRVQLGLFLLLAPVLAASFGHVPLVSPLANALAIPLFAFLVVPLVLGGLALLAWPAAAGKAFMAAGWLLERLLELLAALAAVDPGLAVPQSGLAAGFCALLALVLLAAPRAWPGRGFAPWLLLPATVPLLFALWPGWRSAPPLAVHFLDVGQGLAVVVETPAHTLVYDTGPRFGDSDAAAMVLLPFLEARGRRPDLIVISHGDSDHAGGLATLRKRFPQARVAGRVDAAGATDCAGLAWEWEGVVFEMLAPDAAIQGTDNDASCVLSIRRADFHVLLSGDIEKAAERRLLQQHGNDLRADIVLVPHHGSLTSSSSAFVRAVAPRVAIAGAGHGNQWGFPKPAVRHRWEAVGALLLTTGEQGCISAIHDGVQAGLYSFRGERRLWRQPPAYPVPVTIR